MKSLNKTGLSMNLKIQIWLWSNWKTKFLRFVNSHAPIRTTRAGHCHVMAARRASEAPTIKANFAPGVLQRSVSLPDIWRPLTSEYFTHKKQELRLDLIDTRPGSSSLPANSDGRNGGNTKSCTS